MKAGSFIICVALSAFSLLVNLVNVQGQSYGAGYVLPVPGDCYKYQVCDYSGCFVFNCGIGTEFNPKILVCDHPLRDRGACGSRGIITQGPAYPGGYPPGGNPGYPATGNPGYPATGNPGYPATGNPGYPATGNPGYPGYPAPAAG